MLRERGVEFDAIEYLEKPLSRQQIESILDRLPDPPAELVRKDKNFHSLDLDAENYESRESVVHLLLEHPKLMQRPIVVSGDRAVIARPPEKVHDLLD